MIVSRPEFVKRFIEVFGDMLDDQEFLLCFRTKMLDGEYFYAAPFVIRKPIDLYYHMANVDGELLDKLVEQHADVVLLGYWSDTLGLCPLVTDLRVFASFAGLFLTNEEVSE